MDNIHCVKCAVDLGHKYDGANLCLKCIETELDSIETDLRTLRERHDAESPTLRDDALADALAGILADEAR